MNTVAIVAASDFNRDHFLKMHESGGFGAVYAVDYGFAHLAAIGCSPDLTIGDFDSLGYVPSGVRVQEHPVHKDASDLELALEEAAHDFAEAVVYGALGGRLDHTIAAVQACARFAEQGLGILMVGDGFALRFVVGPGLFDVPVMDSGTVSVFSATDESHGVCERGMEYSLDDAVLTNRTSLGLSNELVGLPASVSVETGTLLVFHPLG